MNRFIRYFNQNRFRIIITILIVAFIIILIQIINYILKQFQTDITQTEPTIVDSSIPRESVITGEELPEETTETNVNIIKQFVEFCNNKEYENAYNLLSQDCKDELFNTLDLFISNYCNKIFTTEITYSLELWYNTSNTYTYRIIYSENNILQTGSTNSSNNIEDYITIIKNNGENQLNINSFIGKDNINRTQNAEGLEISITVNDRYIYRDYESYNITIRNNTDKTILISEGINGNDICLIDTNEVEYNSILNEIPVENLELTPGMERTLEIRFYKMFNLYRTIESVSFKNIILDKNEYINKIENLQKTSINIEV